MKVLKFGGTSVATPERIAGVVDIVADARAAGQIVVVTSAFGGVTNALARTAALAAESDGAYRDLIDEIDRRHREAVEAVAGDGDRPTLLGDLDDTMAALRDLLHGISLVAECSRRTLDRILSVGERLSTAVLAAALRKAGVSAAAIDARDLIVTDTRFGSALVDHDTTNKKIQTWFADFEPVAVITGFIGATPDGAVTTLGRGGSDYTASIVGAALGAEEIEIWTDVDGVLTADPRLVPTAFTIPALSYNELMELTLFGAKVVFPPTVIPARHRSIPLRIRNTLNPQSLGTLISEEPDPSAPTVRGISSIDSATILTLDGDGMVGVPGIAARLFGVLAREEISVIMISQTSSEHSICFAIQSDTVPAAAVGIEREFQVERSAGLINPVSVESDVSIIAAVGAGMREQPGIAGRLFMVLGNLGINIRAIAQGSSELNVSFVIDRRDEARGLVALHEAFFAARAEPVA